MPDRYTYVTVVCEDTQQSCFMYRFLTAKGLKPHRLIMRPCPTARGGDAKQFVRRNHVAEVRAMRAKPHLLAGVITIIDADDSTVGARKDELNDALVAEGQDRRQADERIAVAVPRREIETWIHSLQGRPVDEETRYPRFRGDERQCAPAASEFARKCPSDMQEDDLPSLKDACKELDAFLKKAAR